MKLRQHMSRDPVNQKRGGYITENRNFNRSRKRAVLYDIKMQKYRNAYEKKREWISVPEEVEQPGDNFFIIYFVKCCH